MTKDEIIARILESLQSEAIDEIWARQHITDAFEEGFDAGAQSKEEEIAMLRSAHVISVEQAKTKAVQSLFSRVTPCGKSGFLIEEPDADNRNLKCGDYRGGKPVLCDLCRGRAVGREEQRKPVTGAMKDEKELAEEQYLDSFALEYFPNFRRSLALWKENGMRNPSDAFTESPQRFAAQMIIEAKNEGRLDAAKNIQPIFEICDEMIAKLSFNPEEDGEGDQIVQDCQRAFKKIREFGVGE